jgi:hypothetical protein
LYAYGRTKRLSDLSRLAAGLRRRLKQYFSSSKKLVCKSKCQAETNMEVMLLRNFQRTTRRYIPEDRTLQEIRCWSDLDVWTTNARRLVFRVVAYNSFVGFGCWFVCSCLVISRQPRRRSLTDISLCARTGRELTTCRSLVEGSISSVIQPRPGS